MKWKNKKWPNAGDIREKTRFLIFPKTINGETRWLEKASWVEEYKCGYDDISWEPIDWLEYYTLNKLNN